MIEATTNSSREMVSARYDWDVLGLGLIVARCRIALEGRSEEDVCLRRKRKERMRGKHGLDLGAID